MKTKTMNQTTAANTNEDVIATDLNELKLERLGERLSAASASTKDAEALALHGWLPAEADELSSQLAHVARLRAEEADARALVSLTVRSRDKVQQAAEATRDRLANGLRLPKVRPVVNVPADFLKVNKTTRKPELLRAWFVDGRVFALKAVPQLTAHMGADPIETIDATIASLLEGKRAVSAAQRALKKTFLRGRKAQQDLSDSIDSLLLVARTAFRNDPSSMLKFRKNNGVRYVKAAKPDSSKSEEAKATEPKAEAPKAEQPKTEETKAA